MKVIVTGFEPFGKLTVNPSWEAVKQISERPGKNITVKKLLLPVEYEKCADILIDNISAYHPDAVICTGVAVKRREITPEYVAVNMKDSPSPDNAGKTCIFQPIIDEGESALYTTLPIADVVDTMHAAGVPSALSFDAGAYVCNNLFYRLMYYIKNSSRKIYGGFIHIPPEEWVSHKEAARAIEATLLMLADKEKKK